MLNSEKTRIMVFGTFDFLHKGHSNFFRQARSLSKNPYLIVSVARDFNVKRIKGRLPLLNEQKRKRALTKIKLVDKVVLGGIKNFIPHIVKESPQIIALGYDQQEYVRGLGKSLKSRGISVKIYRLKPFYPQKYKSSLVKPQKH